MLLASLGWSHPSIGGPFLATFCAILLPPGGLLELSVPRVGAWLAQFSESMGPTALAGAPSQRWRVGVNSALYFRDVFWKFIIVGGFGGSFASHSCEQKYMGEPLGD